MSEPKWKRLQPKISEFLALGLNHREIAERLGCDRSTVSLAVRAMTAAKFSYTNSNLDWDSLMPQIATLLRANYAFATIGQILGGIPPELISEHYYRNSRGEFTIEERNLSEWLSRQPEDHPARIAARNLK